MIGRVENQPNSINENSFPGLTFLQQCPKKEIYRFLVDGIFHDKEHGFARYAIREPGCLPALFDALQYALTKLTKKDVSPELICAVHQKVLNGVTNVNRGKPGVLRNHPTSFHSYKNIDLSTDQEDISELAKEMNSLGGGIVIDSSAIEMFLSIRRTTDKIAEDSYNNLAKFKTNQPIVWDDLPDEVLIIPPDANKIDELLKHACDDYNQNITFATTTDEKLRIILKYLQSIVRIHPFPDGNDRVCYVLLQRLLVQNGFTPTMLKNIRCITEFSLKHCVDEIIQGIELAKTFRDQQFLSAFNYKTQDTNEIKKQLQDEWFSKYGYMAPEVGRMDPDYFEYAEIDIILNCYDAALNKFCVPEIAPSQTRAPVSQIGLQNGSGFFKTPSASVEKQGKRVCCALL